MIHRYRVTLVIEVQAEHDDFQYSIDGGRTPYFDEMAPYVLDRMEELDVAPYDGVAASIKRIRDLGPIEQKPKGDKESNGV